MGKATTVTVAVIVTAALVTAIVVPMTYFLHPDYGKDCPEDEEELSMNERVDCYPEGGADQESCESRGCIWDDAVTDENSGAPYCFYPSDYGSYRMVGEAEEFSWGYRVALERLDRPTMYDKDMYSVILDLEYHTDTTIRFKFYDPSNQRFEVPIDMPSTATKATNTLYDVEFTSNPFSMKIIRTDTMTVLWDTAIGGFTMSDQFLSISTRLPSSNIYGFGEHEHPQFRHDLNWQSWGMFSRDQPPSRGNLYGVQPFYTCLEEDTNSHGVLLMNSNAMDITLQPLPALTYRTIGGILDFWMFLGPTPEDVVGQYTAAIGRPYMPPYWSLGFQLCRYGYNSLDRVKEVVAGMREYDIPHDVQYGDIDYMLRQLDFTYDPDTYAGLPEYVHQLKAEGTHYITILDPAISVNETVGTYAPYENGTASSIFITEEDGETELLGKVWPDPPNIDEIMQEIDCQGDWDCEVENYRAHAVFPDWIKPGCADWWIDHTVDFHDTLAFDGLWIDMNEPANFVKGSTKGCDYNNILESPPYKPRIYGDVLADKTVCMAAVTYNTPTTTTTQYNMHSLFGLTQTEPSLRAARLSTPGKRSLVVSRSTFPSSGKYSGHWLGDNTSIWPHMHMSIIGMMEFNLFGIPYIGADICGFFEDTTEDLCRRWTQLGAFYPYCRNHNGIDFMPQDPASFGPEFAAEAREILHVRYTLLPYLYTLFFYSHTTGSTVVRPLMHEFTNDAVTWSIDRQFLWGPALMISPVLDEGAVEVDVYVPDTRWFDYYTGQEVPLSYRGKSNVLSAPMDYIPLHVRGGHIIPTQQPANSTVFSRELPFGLIVALGDDYTASGSLFWDDGDSVDTIEDENYFMESFTASSNQVDGEITVSNYVMDQLTLDDVTILGLESTEISSVTLDGMELNPLQWSIDETLMKLTIENLQHPMDNGFNLVWS
ncbi:sucrase-isomaltase, intestinal-like [Ptychodera flava]|uniref:sucrase-isomaltase, intestinal-like n=1 Tax=Ptychodera flava TaxID=63121 RepID=UPI00396A9374